MATVEELLARIERLEKAVYGHRAEAVGKGLATSQKIQEFVKQFAKANRVVSVKEVARQMKLSEARIWHEYKSLAEQGVIENLGRGFGYLSKVYEGK